MPYAVDNLMKEMDREKGLLNKQDHALADQIRDEVLDFSKTFKTSWLNLGRHLYSVHRDKLYQSWGFEKFEDYAESELGIKKTTCMKMLNSYLFLEQNEPNYLKESFAQDRQTHQVPGVDQINVLRLARRNKDLNADDYQQLKHSVFDQGKNDSVVRKDMAALIRERKGIDPEEEREMRKEQAIKRAISALEGFQKDMDVLKLIPQEIVEEAEDLKEKLAQEI